MPARAIAVTARETFRRVLAGRTTVIDNDDVSALLSYRLYETYHAPAKDCHMDRFLMDSGPGGGNGGCVGGTDGCTCGLPDRFLVVIGGVVILETDEALRLAEALIVRKAWLCGCTHTI